MEQPTYSKEKPWAIFRLLSIKYAVLTARFKTKADAEVYVRIFKKHNPNSRYKVVFDPFNTGKVN
jgi:DNA gyrase inhibitor GyrI